MGKEMESETTRPNDENTTSAPELMTHNRLKEDDIKNLEVITDEDFSDIIDSMLLNDYRHIPNVIRLPNIRGDLAEKLGLEKDSAFIMKNGISHIRPDRKGSYGQAFSDEEYRMIPEVMRNANFAVVDKYFKNFQIVFDDQNEENKVNKIVFNKDKLGNYLITIGKVDRQNAFSEERNEVVGVGFAPTIRTLRMGVSSTRLRASPTTENSIAQEYKSVNETESPEEKIMENETEEMETKSNEEAANLLMPKEYLKSLLSRAEIEVIEDSGIMRTILDEGKRVQQMAAKYGTNQDIDGEEAFNGFGTYVVSVNEENARQLGIKIASKKYGGNFYINGQPFNEFLREKNFSPYWTSRMKQFSGHNVEYLADDFLRADVKGNPALEKERDTLSTLFSLDLVEYKRERAFLYSVDIPDNDSTNYLLYSNPIGIESANRINDRLERMNAEWRVTRNDIGKNVYFNTLSEKVFGGSQESASRFLKEIGYVGMEMNAANYIVFDDKDMKVTDRVQYMIDGESNVYGFAYDGRIYADPEIATSNTYAHEYTHLWDAYTRRTNPELWEKGKDIFKGTSLWNEVMTDENYQNLSDDDEILSECHSRIVGRMAEKVLSRIAEKNGGLLRDQVIDWDNEVAEYVAGELGAEFPQPELGGENYVSDSVRREIAREFLSRPMKDLMEGRKIGIEREKSELYKENEAELKFIVEEMMEETLPGLQKMAQPVENEKDPAASTSTQLSGATSAQDPLDAQDTATAISTHIHHKNNIVEIKNQGHFIDMFNAFAGEIANADTPMPPNEFLDRIKKTFDMNVATETTGYAFAREDDKTFKIRISNHKAVLKNRTGDKTEITSVVIQLCDNKGQDNQKTRLSEFVYFPESLDKETQVGIINGINDWISGHEYTDKHYDQMYVSTARALQERLKESEQTVEKMAEDHAFPDVREYFKFNRTDSENFEKALDNFDGRNPLQLIKVGEIPPVMKALGISDNPIEMPQSVVSKALREEATYPNDKKGHALTMEHVKRIPESLADPIMVFKSRTRDDSYVFFTEQKDESDRSIIIPVAVDKRYGRLVINEITSIYGRTNEVDFVKTNIEQGNLVYADKKRSLEWERECQVQFLAQVLPSEGSYSSILTKENLVNFVSAVGKEKIQKMAQSVENAIAEPTAEAWAKDIETKLNLGMEQDISKILAESEAVGVKENASEIAGEICGSILSVYKEIAEHGDTGYFKGGERQMSNKFAGNCTQKVLEAHGIFLPNYPDESGEREKLFSTIQQVSDEISDFIKTNTYENFLHRQDVGTQQDIGLADNEMTTAERPNHGAEADYTDPIETAEAWHNGTDGEQEENVAAARKTVRASEIFKDFEESMIFSGISHKEFDRAMLGYLHQRSGREEAGNGTFDTQAMFELLVVQKIHDARARAFAFGKIGQYEGMTVEFDADNIDLGYLRLSDREGAEEVRKELEELKAAHPILVRNLAGRDEPVAKAEQNPFLAAEPELVQELHEQAEAVEKMQQEAASNVEFDKDGNPYYPKSEAAEENSHPVPGEEQEYWKDKFVNDNSETFKMLDDKKISESTKDGLVKQPDGIIFGKTKVPEFAMITQNGLKAFSGMMVTEHDTAANSWTLSNESGERIVLKDKALKELTSKESVERAKKFTENTSVIEKVLEAQYDDFFRQRENTANNFRHNLSVYCRKEANSPLEALKVANVLVKDMSTEERRKTKELLKALRKDGETVNEVIMRTYLEAVKETPLNEDHLKRGRYDKIVARPMYDMISARGAKIDDSFDLKIGDVVNGIAFNTDKTFGIGKDKIFQDCKIISASKENNMVTLMDGNKSFYDVPRDTFLKEYAKREKYEKKQEIKEAHKKNIMRLDIER